MDLPSFSGRPDVYLIASTPRCGSHMLGHALIEAGDLGVPLEYLNPWNMQEWNTRLWTSGVLPMLREIVRRRTSPKGTFGLKAHWSQFEPFSDGALLDEFGGVKLAIWLRRRDLLAQAVSLYVAASSGKWISGARQERDVVFDFDAIYRAGDTIRAQNAAWKAFFVCHPQLPLLEVAYEDLVADPDAELAKVADFLRPREGAPLHLSNRTRRQSDGRSAEFRERFVERLGDPEHWFFRRSEI
jgi:trehalose 2-sulfotransferase